jgi:ribosomal protein S18 acetylase RimI-like enzyme
MSNISFRKVASEKDWKQFLDLEKVAFHCSPYYLAFTNITELKKFIGNSVVYLMFDGTKPIGHVEYEMKNKESAEITGFVLSPDYRGQGLGKLLFGKAMDDLKNTKQVFLMTHPENSKALKVYLTAGFIIKGWKDNYYGNGQPRLRLELNRK